MFILKSKSKKFDAKKYLRRFDKKARFFQIFSLKSIVSTRFLCNDNKIYFCMIILRHFKSKTINYNCIYFELKVIEFKREFWKNFDH